jgi:hypothetical protein
VEQKQIQNHSSKIRVRKIHGGGNYATKYGIISTLSHKRYDFRKNLIEYAKFFYFLYNICLKHF